MTKKEIREMHLEIDRLLKLNEDWQEKYAKLEAENKKLILEFEKLRDGKEV